jgi:2-dehydropantoate 2-reductase
MGEDRVGQGMLSVAVVGAGALGGLFGVLLAEAGLRITVLSRRAEVVDMIRREGIAVRDESTAGASPFTGRVEAQLAGAADGPFDAVVLLNKSFDTEWAMGIADGVVAADGVIVSMQNGLRTVPLVEAHPRGVVGTTYQGAAYEPDGTVVWSSPGPTLVAPRPRLEAATRRLVDATAGSRLPLTIAPDRDVMVWSKLVAAISNSVSGALLVSVAEALQSDAVWDVLDRARAEAFDVAGALGVRLDRADMEARFAARPKQASRGTLGSTYQSLVSGRVTEVGDISGAIVEAARSVGVATPCNELLDLLVKAREELADLRGA